MRGFVDHHRGVPLPGGRAASPAAGVVGRAVRGSETDTQVMARVAEESRAEVWVVPTDEEREIARATLEVLGLPHAL